MDSLLYSINHCWKHYFYTQEKKSGILLSCLEVFWGDVAVKLCWCNTEELPSSPCTERAMPRLCPMGLAWCNGLPTTHYSYKVPANHTIDPVIPPIWNSLPRLAVSMSEDRVAASLLASFPSSSPLAAASGEVIETYVTYPQPSFVFFLVFIRRRLHREKSVRRNAKRQKKRKKKNQTGWSTSFPLTVSLCNFSAVLCWVLLCHDVLQVLFFVYACRALSHQWAKVGMRARWSLRLGTLGEYQWGGVMGRIWKMGALVYCVLSRNTNTHLILTATLWLHKVPSSG